jgi:hypothetical protein
MQYDENIATSNICKPQQSIPKRAAASKPVSTKVRPWSAEHVKCVLKRVRGNLQEKMYPKYELWDDAGELLIVAKKLKISGSSSYHMFDMSKPGVADTTSKTSPNYLGSLKAKDSSRYEYVLMSSQANKLGAIEEVQIGTITFTKQTIMQFARDNEPRSVTMILPRALIEANTKIAAQLRLTKKLSSDTGASLDMWDIYHNYSGSITIHDNNYGTRLLVPELPLPKEVEVDVGPLILHSKRPVKKLNGNYGLVFFGRRKQSSLKNFQMVLKDDSSNENSVSCSDIVCQFGKFTENEFDLDFKLPLNTMQAFALAMCQFDTLVLGR